MPDIVPLVNPFHQLARFDRDVSVTGRDFTWEDLGDIKTTPSGDFRMAQGSEGIVLALLRRLYTPEQGYRRWVRDANGLRQVDTNYGNKAYSILSHPSSPRSAEKVRDAIAEAAAQDPRIHLINLSVMLNRSGQFQMLMDYRIRGHDELQNLDLVLPAPL